MVDGIEIDRDQAKRFGVFECDLKGDPVKLFYRYENVAGVLAATKRLDKRWKVQVGKHYLTLDEFKKLYGAE